MKIEFDKFKKLIFEARELHVYPDEIETKIISRLTGGNDSFDLNRAYWNSEAGVFWFMNTKGYLHILKPINWKQLDGTIKFGFAELLISDDGMMTEIRRYKFDDKAEAKEWLQKTYHYDETISLTEKKKKSKKKKRWIRQARFFSTRVMPIFPKPPKHGPGPCPPPPGPHPPGPLPPGPPPPGPPPPGPAPAGPAM